MRTALFGEYEVREDGSIFSLKHGKRKPIKHSYGSFGYPLFTFCEMGTRKTVLIHQLVASLFVGQKPSASHEVRHIDGNPKNCAASNLEWCTHKQNMRDRKIHGTACNGSQNGNSKLTESEVRRIKKACASGKHSLQTIADVFGVTRPTIGYIARGETWQHVEI